MQVMSSSKAPQLTLIKSMKLMCIVRIVLHFHQQNFLLLMLFTHSKQYCSTLTNSPKLQLLALEFFSKFIPKTPLSPYVWLSQHPYVVHLQTEQ